MLKAPTRSPYKEKFLENEFATRKGFSNFMQVRRTDESSVKLSLKP